MSRRYWLVRSIAAAAALTLAGGLAGCGTGGGSGSGGAVLTVATGQSTTFVPNFNPYSPNLNDAAQGMVYEPLFFFDTAKAGSVQPWLGTSYTWSDAGKQLTVQLRKGVKWTDGKPFTSADVAYTIDLALHDPALNQNALPLAGVSTNGPYSVTIDFTTSAYSDDYIVLGKTFIVPRHIWQSVPNKATWLDSKPVGTGAYVVDKVSGQSIQMTANPNYYLPGMPHFKTVRFLAYTSNTASDEAIESGELDWAGSFIPDLKHTYLSKDPKFAVSDIPLSTAFLEPNMRSGPTTNLAVRQAISAALDRSYISDTVYNGYAPPTNTGALITPDFNAVRSSSVSAFPKADVARARSILAQAGLTSPVRITCKVIGGYTDYVSDLEIISQELKAAGIDLTVDSESNAAWVADRSTGNFQMLIDNQGYTPSPYYYYYELLNSKVAPPIGQNDSIGNFGRYSNPRIDALLGDIGASRNELADARYFAQIEQIVSQDLPVIPLFEQQDEIEFNGAHVAGFPTPSNPYAAPAVYIKPDIGWVAMHLTPAS